jgi:hypothetical protein
MTVKDLEEQVLKRALNMVAPDVILDGKGTVIISSEEGETTENNPKKLVVSYLSFYRQKKSSGSGTGSTQPREYN